MLSTLYREIPLDRRIERVSLADGSIGPTYVFVTIGVDGGHDHKLVRLQEVYDGRIVLGGLDEEVMSKVEQRGGSDPL